MWRSSSPPWTASLPSPWRWSRESRSSRCFGGEFPASAVPTADGAVPAVSHSLHRFPDSTLRELEKMLAKVELEGQNQTFGNATVHATVLRVQPSQAPQHLAFASQREVGPEQPALMVLTHQHHPTSLLMSLSLQEGREVHGFTVDLPSSLFVMAKGREEVVEHRVLLININSQTMFQVSPCMWHGGGSPLCWGLWWYRAARMPPRPGCQCSLRGNAAKMSWKLVDLLLGDSHLLHPQQLSLPMLPPPPLLLQQDEKSSHVLGDKVVGISLVDTVVANLSDPVVITFFHNQLPVGGETASSNLIPPRMEGQGGLRPCRGREWSQSMPLACLQALLHLLGLYHDHSFSVCAGGGASSSCPGAAALQMCYLQHNLQGWGTS